MKFMYLILLYALFIPTLTFSENKPLKSIEQEEVSPNEDLMREHGILNRLLLIYQEIVRRIESNQDFPIDSLVKSAKLVRDFLENYHEKLEEDHIFPLFKKENPLFDLVQTLKDQHDAGRKLTDYILSHANEQSLRNQEERYVLSHYLKLYIRMFRPHEAREDTVLFPAFRKILSSQEYEKLGDKFEEIEHKLFGENGFNRIVNQVADIEKQLGIYNLSQFTPQFNENK